jgi:hypothetical protein
MHESEKTNEHVRDIQNTSTVWFVATVITAAIRVDIDAASFLGAA